MIANMLSSLRKCYRLILAFALAAAVLSAQTYSPLPYVPMQFLNANGQPLAGGTICTYAAGTTTPLATYTTSAATTQNATCALPGVGGISLNAAGMPTSGGIYVTSGVAYKYVAYDSGRNVVWTQDNVHIPPPAGASGAIQFNLNGVMGSDSSFSYNATSHSLKVGSISATLTDAGGQVYNVKGYGAAGDGATNDQASIANAQAAVTSAGGGTLYFSHGSYVMTGITLTSNETVRCADPGTALLAPPGSNFVMFQANSISNVRIENCQLNGRQVGSSASGILIQLQCVTNAWIADNYLHDTGGAQVGVDTNSPACISTTGNSNNIHIERNVMASSHSTVIADVQMGAGAFNLDVGDNVISDGLAGQLLIDCDECNNTKIHDNILSGIGTNSVSACIQLETSSPQASTTSDVQIENNWCSNVQGSQAGIFVAASGGSATKTLSNILVAGNHIVNVKLRGEEVTDFAGGANTTIRNINIVGEQITGTSNNAALYLWKHNPGSTVGNINVSGVQIDGCGTGDGNGCVVLSGAINQVSFSGMQVFNIPSAAYAFYHTGDTANGVGIAGNWAYTGGTANSFTNVYSNLYGFFILGLAPTGGCTTAIILNSVTGHGYTCQSGAWVQGF